MAKSSMANKKKTKAIPSIPSCSLSPEWGSHFYVFLVKRVLFNQGYWKDWTTFSFTCTKFGSLIAEFGNNTTCNVSGCRKAGTKLTRKNLADHMGQVHNHVDKYLPEENRIPMKVQRLRSRSRRLDEVQKGSQVNCQELIFSDFCW